MTTCLRAILHLDLDCYYAQVEAKTRGIPRDEPLVVQQWGGLLAVNYPARAKGVKRGMRIDEATRLCPGLHTPHVPVIGDQASSSTHPDRSHAKVSLDKYRGESQQIFALLERMAPTIERVSIDEAYLDVSELAAAELARGKVFSRWADTTACVRGGGDERWRPDPNDPMDSMLLGAAAVCERLRAAVRDELGYAISAGIAHSKMVAKLASAKHKPNQQTIIPRAAVPLVMATMPLRDVRGLGGQLGERVATQLGVTMAGELRGVAHETLVSMFGDDTARWLAAVADGGLDDEVTPSVTAKSLNAIKSFAATRDDATIRRWVGLLAAELVERMANDREMNDRVPSKLKVQFRGGLSGDHKDNWVAGRTAELTPVRSRQCTMPGGGQRVLTPAQVAAAALRLLVGDGSATGTGAGTAWPTLTRIAISVSDFVPCAGPGVAAFFSATVDRPAARGHEAAAAKEAAAEEVAAEEEAGEAVAAEEVAAEEAAEVEGDFDEEAVAAVEEAAASAAPSTTLECESWQCRRCTFLNSVLLPLCEMCDERRAPVKTSPARSAASKRSGAGRAGGGVSGAKNAKRTRPPPARGLEAFGFETNPKLS